MPNIDVDAEIYSIRHKVQTVKPSTTGAGYSHVFVKADGLYLVDENDVEIGPYTADGKTLIEEISPTGQTCSFTSIPGTYNKLIIESRARTDRASTFEVLTVYMNGDSTPTNYRKTYHWSNGANNQGVSEAAVAELFNVPGGNSPTGSFSYSEMTIYEYASTSMQKIVNHFGGFRLDDGTTQLRNEIATMEWENTAAITQIVIGTVNGSDFVTPTIFRLYGEM